MVINERREQFRIETHLTLSWSLVSAETEERDKLATINAELHSAIEELALFDDQAAKVARLLNRKIAAIHAALTNDDTDGRWLPVNLSASGISFDVDSAIDRPNTLLLTLTLPDSGELVSLKADVIECAPQRSDVARYRVRCAFLTGQEAASDQILAFINRSQLTNFAAQKQ